MSQQIVRARIADMTYEFDKVFLSLDVEGVDLFEIPVENVDGFEMGATVEIALRPVTP